MTLYEAVVNRHSVRSYESRPIGGRERELLLSMITQINQQEDLNFQLIADMPGAFDGFAAHYGGFRNVQNYIALIGPDTEDLEEKCGYYGEQLVLEAVRAGLSTCWVGGTFNRRKIVYSLRPGDRLVAVIAIGYGAETGKPHRSKKGGQVSRFKGAPPAWFIRAVKTALLAPTALNQQKFRFTLRDGDVVEAKAGRGPFSKVDLGIACYHFEIGAGSHPFTWAK